MGSQVARKRDVVGGDGAAVFVAEEVFEQDAEGEGEAGEVGSAERALRRKRLTVVAPEVRVPALWKESGFWSVMVFSVFRQGARGRGWHRARILGPSAYDPNWGVLRREGKAYQKFRACAVMGIRTGRGRGDRDGSV